MLRNTEFLRKLSENEERGTQTDRQIDELCKMVEKNWLRIAAVLENCSLGLALFKLKLNYLELSSSYKQVLVEERETLSRETLETISKKICDN